MSAGIGSRSPDVPLPFDSCDPSGTFVFVSYAHADKALAYPELRRICSFGIRVWYDEGIEPGSEWPEVIASALKKATAFVVIITPRAVVSRNVKNEISAALNWGKPFIAIHLAQTQLPLGLELQMGDFQAVMRWHMDEDSYARKLSKALTSCTQLSEAKGENTRLRNEVKKLAERAEAPGPEHMPKEGWEAPSSVQEEGPVREAEQQDEEAWRPTGRLNLKVRRGRDYAIVTASGEMDEYTAPQLRELLIDLVSKNNCQIIVNLDEVEFFDSTGLGVLTGGLKRVRAHDGSLDLVCTQERLLKIFRITGLTKQFGIYETVDQAIEAEKGR